ncbi:hypothetical protein NMY22_g20241 [Coprinellus aureogranulatus]|nr:hypothetical protein NMY22_g20241 [Coprinellus aureogranulatus]
MQLEYANTAEYTESKQRHNAALPQPRRAPSTATRIPSTRPTRHSNPPHQSTTPLPTPRSPFHPTSTLAAVPVSLLPLIGHGNR